MSRETTLGIDSLGDLIKKEQVIYKLRSKTKQQAVKELVHKLCELGMVDGEGMIVRRVMDRESLESTGVGHGIAFPHARVEVGELPLLAVGRSETGIPFNAINNEPVRIVTLILWQPSIPGLFNQLFGSLARQFSNESFTNLIKEANNEDEMYRILSRIPFSMSSADVGLNKSMLLLKLQEMELKIKNVRIKKEKDALKKQIDLIREDLDRNILWRFDRLLEKDGIAVVSLENGTCQGCFLRLSSGFASTVLKDPNNIYVCERCGKYLSVVVR